MTQKIFWMAIIWGAVIFAYLILGFTMPAMNEIIATTNASLVASANMSNFPGTQEAIETAPIWLWVIPGFVGIVGTTIMLISK